MTVMGTGNVRLLHNAHFGRKGGFQSFAAVVSLPSEKDGSGHSERVKIEDFSAVPHGGSEPLVADAAACKFRC